MRPGASGGSDGADCRGAVHLGFPPCWQIRLSTHVAGSRWKERPQSNVRPIASQTGLFLSMPETVFAACAQTALIHGYARGFPNVHSAREECCAGPD